MAEHRDGEQPEVVAMTLQPSRAPHQDAQSSSLYSMDTAMLALGLVGAWMVIIGGAMLARRLNQIKMQRDTL